MRLQRRRRLRVQHQPDRRLRLLHRGRHRVPPIQLIHEPRPILVDQEPADAAQSFRGKELRLRAGVLGVDEAGGVDLDLVHVAEGAAEGGGEAVAVAGGVVAVGGGEGGEVGAMLGEEAAGGEVGGVASSGGSVRVQWVT